MTNVKFNINTLTLQELESLLNSSSNYFVPPLSTQVDIKQYSEKLYNHADIIYGIDNTNQVIAYLAYYINTKESFITSVCVMPSAQGTSVSKLLFQFYEQNIKDKVSTIRLEVHSDNLKAIAYYKKRGFNIVKSTKAVYEAYKSIS